MYTHIFMWFIDILISMYQVRVCDFIPEFRGKIQQYIQHVDMAWWQDEQFRICWDTFPLETILSLRAGEHNGAYHVLTWER